MRTVNVRTEGDDMDSYTSIFLGGDDRIRSEHRDGSQYPAMLLIKQCHGIGDLSIFADRPVLERLHNVIGAYLADHPAEPAPPVPAEASTGVTVDADDLFAAMAVSYDVRRGSWDDEPETIESLAIEEIRDTLTAAAQSAGIDPDGMDDLSVIRALARRTGEGVAG